MILNKIKLIDFISHKDSELNLDYGINIVVGPNGAGKTSILDAISFALFNDYSGRGKKENLINSKASRCKAAVEFTEGGIKYAVEWSMERNKAARGSLWRFQGDNKSLQAQGGGSALVPQIENILGIDKSMFLQSIYVRQGEIEELVTAKPGERKKLISRLLGIDDLEMAWNDIKPIIDGFQSTSDQLKGELLQKSTIETEKHRHIDVGNQYGSEIRTKTTELTKIDTKILDLQGALERLSEEKNSFDLLTRNRDLVENEINKDKESLSDRKVELEQAIKAQEIVKSLETDVSKLRSLESLVAAASLKREQEAHQKRLTEKLENLTRLELTMKDNETGRTIYLDRENLLKKKSAERETIEGAVGALREMTRHLVKVEKETQNKTSDLQKELDRWKTPLEDVTVANFESLLSQKREQFRLDAEQKARSVNEVTGRIAGLKSRLGDLEINISKFGDAEAKGAACPTCETELTADRVVQLVSKFKAEKANLKEELQKTESELEQATEQQMRSDTRFREVDRLDAEKLKSLIAEVNEKNASLTQMRTEIRQLEAQADALKVLDDDVKLLESEKADVEEAFREYESARRELAKSLSREQIQSEMVPIAETLAIACERVRDAVSSLGYDPEEPEKELDSLRVKKQEYDRNVALANRRSEFEKSVNSLALTLQENNGKLAEINDTIKKLAYDEQMHWTKQVEFDTTAKMKGELDKQIASLAARKNDAEKEIENCNKKLTILKKREREKNAVDGFVNLLNRIRTAYGKDGVQKMIRATARPLLERSTRDLFERFNLAYSDIKIDDDYNIKVIGPSGEQDIDQISGGERVALAIALRLAVAQVLSGKVETIIMDEPTTHLDEERRKELVNILSSFFREGGRIIPQMLIITHHREIEDVADVIYTVKKEQGYSTAEIAAVL